jgi:hypothetical protein
MSLPVPSRTKSMEILSLVMLAVTAGTFLLVPEELPINEAIDSYRPSILATTKMSIAPPRPPPKSRYNKE